MASALTHPASSSLKYKIVLLVLAAAVQVYVLARLKTSHIAVLAVALVVFAYLMTGPVIERLLLVALTLICLQPYELWNRPLQPAAVFLALAAFIWWSNRITDRTAAAREPVSRFESSLLILVAVVVLGAIRGISRGQDQSAVIFETTTYSYFLLPLLMVRTRLSESGIRKLLVLSVALTVVVSLLYLRRAAFAVGPVRATSDAQHLLNLGIPLVFAFFLKEGRPLRKLGYGLLLAVMAAATVVTLTRALWLYVPISLVLLLVLLVRYRQINFPRRTVAAVVLAALLLIIVRPGQSGGSAGHNANGLAARAQTFRSLSQDLSLLARYDLSLQTLKQWSHSPLLGCGLGCYVRYRVLASRTAFYQLDASYLAVLWKLGLAGLLAFLTVYFLFLQRIWYVYRHAASEFQVLTSAGCLVAVIGLLITGIESGILVIYRFNILLAILMGVFEVWTRRIKAQQPTPADERKAANTE